jgi:hypothetical protein
MATMDDRFAPAHVVQVVRDDRTYGLGWRATCSCGWAGDWQDDPAMAAAAVEDHREIVVGPGDGLDWVMGELLDLQDDLAQVVMWLAEHWSAELPVPTVHAYGGPTSKDPARIEVWAYCAEAADLARISRLVGVAPVDDEQPDRSGRRYRNVQRRFGRVLLRAFHGLDTASGAVA